MACNLPFIKQGFSGCYYKWNFKKHTAFEEAFFY
jgi:hypothetical protein